MQGYSPVEQRKTAEGIVRPCRLCKHAMPLVLQWSKKPHLIKICKTRNLVPTVLVPVLIACGQFLSYKI
jgi:hypothetical protein